MELFKTDGIRSTNIAWLCQVGYRLGRAMQGKSKVVLGCDNRPTGDKIVAAVYAGLCDARVDVLYAGVVPTPCVQWATPYYVADAGIVVTASHNAAGYNGLKYIACTGEKAEQEELAALEKALAEAPEGQGDKLPPANPNIAKQYCLSLGKEAAGLDLALAVDCANGAAYATAKRVLGATQAKVHYLHHGEGKHINRDCGALYPDALRQTVLDEGLDMGFALDGDGDRCVAVTRGGAIVDGDGILYLLARDRREQGTLPEAGVVSTILANGALGVALKALGIRLHQCEVGDAHVRGAMARYGCTLGAEPSGHVLTDRPADGLLTGILLSQLAMRRDLDGWLADYRPYPRCSADCPMGPNTLAMAQKAADKWQDYLGATGRVVVRASGTEPVVRIMAECAQASLAHTVVEGIVDSLSRRTKK